jgi:hypothetical protein
MTRLECPPGLQTASLRVRAEAQPRALFEPLVPGGAIGRSPASKRHAVRRQARSVLDIGAAEERFAVVAVASLRAVNEDSKHLTRTEAERRIADLIDAGHDRASLDIVPEYEMAS